MSKICICVIKIPVKELSYFENIIKIKLNSIGLYYINTLQYMEPFLTSINTGDFYFFSISDNHINDSCEMLFLPDDWSFNGKKNDIPFVARMKPLEEFFSWILKSVNKLELYLGDSGNGLSDFETIEIDVSQFTEILNVNFNFCDTNLPDIHLILMNNQGVTQKEKQSVDGSMIES